MAMIEKRRTKALEEKPSASPQEHHDMRHRGVVEVQAFWSLRLHADSFRFDVQQFGEALADRGRVWTDLRSGENERGIDIQDAIARVGDVPHRLLDEDDGVRALPSRIARREEGTDVSGGDGAEQRVGQRVQQHIAIRVSGETMGVRNSDAADAKGNSRLKFVRVETVSDSHARCQVPGTGFQVRVVELGTSIVHSYLVPRT